MPILQNLKDVAILFLVVAVIILGLCLKYKSSQNAECSAKIDEQNMYVELLKKQSSEEQRKLQAVEIAAATALRRAQERYAKIGVEYIPADCTGASQAAIAYAMKIKQQ